MAKTGRKAFSHIAQKVALEILDSLESGDQTASDIDDMIADAWSQSEVRTGVRYAFVDAVYDRLATED